MKTTIKTKDANRALKVLGSLPGVNGPESLAHSIKIDADEFTGVTLERQTREGYASVTIEGEVEAAGSRYVSASQLTRVASSLFSEQVRISATADKVDVSSMKSKSGSKLSVFSPEFKIAKPELSPCASMVIEKQALREIFRKVSVAASKDRAGMLGVIVRKQGSKIVAMSLNGNRIHALNLCDGEPLNPSPLGHDVGYSLPLDGVHAMVQALEGDGEASLAIDGKIASLSTSSATVITQLEECITNDIGKFMDGMNKPVFVAHLGRPEFCEAINQVYRSSDSVEGKKIELQCSNAGQIKIKTVGGEMESSYIIDCKTTGKDLAACFNPIYLIDAMNCAPSDEILFQVGENNGAHYATISGEDHKIVVMGMRLN